MTRTMWGIAAGALAIATTAAAQGSSQANGQICLEPCQLCMQKIQGGAAGGVYDDACSRCDAERTRARQQQQGSSRQGASPSARAESQGTAAQASATPPPGSDVRASLDQAGRNLSRAVNGSASDVRGGMDQLGQRGGVQSMGAVRQNTIISDVVGTFTGQGLNVEYQRPIADRIAGVVGANYSRTNSTTGDLTTFGGEVGADYFPFTYAGQGFRVGPRVALSFGQESVDHTRYFTDFGLGGEAGYNWQLSSGLSFQLAAGVGGRIGGALTSGLDTKLGGDFGPYGKINLGWSW